MFRLIILCNFIFIIYLFLTSLHHSDQAFLLNVQAIEDKVSQANGCFSSDKKYLLLFQFVNKSVKINDFKYNSIILYISKKY